METQQQPEITIVINQEIKDFLLETSKWGKFLAITGYVGVGLLMLMGLGFTIGFTVFSSVTFRRPVRCPETPPQGPVC